MEKITGTCSVGSEVVIEDLKTYDGSAPKVGAFVYHARDKRSSGIVLKKEETTATVAWIKVPDPRAVWALPRLENESIDCIVDRVRKGAAIDGHELRLLMDARLVSDYSVEFDRDGMHKFEVTLRGTSRRDEYECFDGIYDSVNPRHFR